MSEIKLLPCPFCGTHPEDPDHPYVSIETYDALQTECGKCGACWPKIKRSDFDDDMTDADLVGLFNRRAALSFATVAEVFVDGKRLYNITYPADALDKLPKGTPLYLDPPPLSELEVENARLQARVAELDKALAPFAEIAGEAWADGSGWTNAACQNDRICDWFGPSAFLAARRVREGGKVDG